MQGMRGGGGPDPWGPSKPELSNECWHNDINEKKQGQGASLK